MKAFSIKLITFNRIVKKVQSLSYFCIFLLSLSFLSCESMQRNKADSEQAPIIFKEKVVIKNISNSSKKFKIKSIANFFRTKEDIIADIESTAKSESIPIHIASWLYVIRQSKHSLPITTENWIHDPIIFLNSIGTGLCDDRASVLAIIWKWLGYKSRVWELNGHVVPEVYVNSKWQMLDPDYEVFYLNKNNEIASVDELQINKNLIVSPKKKPRPVNHLKENSYTAEKYSKKLSDIYTSLENNYLLEWFTELTPEEDFTFSIPGNSKISFPIKYEKMKAQAAHLETALKLTLYNTGLQKAKIPLVLLEVRGNETIITNDSIATDRRQAMDLNYNLYNKEVSIQMTTDSVELYYALNPQLISGISDFNSIKTQDIKIDSLSFHIVKKL